MMTQLMITNVQTSCHVLSMCVCQDDDEDEKDKGESAADGSGKTKKKKKKKKKAAEEAAGQVTASENSHKHSAEKAVLAHSFRQI